MNDCSFLLFHVLSGCGQLWLSKTSCRAKQLFCIYYVFFYPFLTSINWNSLNSVYPDHLAFNIAYDNVIVVVSINEQRRKCCLPE